MTYRDPNAARTPLHALYLRASVGAADSLSGLAIAPRIPQKKLMGALTYAPHAQGENPLAIVDDTVMGSGKAGMLLTDRAAYFSESRARVPIEAIVQVPVFSHGMGAPGMLHTSLGSLMLPKLLEECTRAMNRVLRAVAFYNRGADRLQFYPGPVRGPVGELAAQVLEHELIALVPMVPSKAMHASSNVGPAWMNGDFDEQLVAYFEESGTGTGERFIAFTDRRVVAHNDMDPIEIPYDSVLDATLQTGMLTNTIVVQTSFGPRKLATLANAECSRRMTDFLLHLRAIPQGQRCAWPAPAPNESDPAAALATLHGLTQPDLRVATMFELIHAAVLQGGMPIDAAKDMVQRVLRLQRALRGGHGISHGYLRTPLGGGDLEAVLSTVFTAPSSRQLLNAQTLRLEYDMRKAGSAAGTIASNVIGLTLLAVVGVGWVSGGSNSVQHVVVTVTDAPGGAAFKLTDRNDVPVGKDNAKIAGGLLESIAQLAAPLLLRRILYGWNAPAHALLQESNATVEARARALIATVDLAPFVAE
ncbi:MAG: hypothetical protein Q8Q09_07120 [Deltaproteobacteria bacterium]|nr:hypothetical protein [Deltaproteobacteria bacterium]